MSDYMVLREWRNRDQHLNVELERRRAAQETLAYRAQHDRKKEEDSQHEHEHEHELELEREQEDEQTAELLPSDEEAAETAATQPSVLSHR